MKYVYVKSYDGTIVRVEEKKVKEYTRMQDKIRYLLDKGISKDEIIQRISGGKLYE